LKLQLPIQFLIDSCPTKSDGIRLILPLNSLSPDLLVFEGSRLELSTVWSRATEMTPLLDKHALVVAQTGFFYPFSKLTHYMSLLIGKIL
jgi:hypothetical protein